MSNLAVAGTHPAVTTHIQNEIMQNGKPSDSFLDSEKLSTVTLSFNQAVKISEKKTEKQSFDEVDDDIITTKTTTREYTVMFPQIAEDTMRDKGYVARNEVPIESWFMKHKDTITPFVTKYTHITKEMTKEVDGEEVPISEPTISQSSKQETNWNVSARAAAARSFVESMVGMITEHCRLIAYKVAQLAFTQTGYGIDLSNKIEETQSRISVMETSLIASLTAMKDPVSVISMINDAISRDETPSFLVKRDDLTWGSIVGEGHGDAPAPANV